MVLTINLTPPKKTLTMNVVALNGSITQQMFQYGLYLRLVRGHDAQALLQVPGGKPWLGGTFELPHAAPATPQQLNHWGRGTLGGRLLAQIKGGKGRVVADSPYDPAILGLTDTCFDGSWLDERWFAPVADELRAAYTTSLQTLPPIALDVAARLQGADTVAVHVHRPQDKDAVCTSDYYNWAIASMCQQLGQPRFVVLTTHGQWVRERLDFHGFEHEIVEYPARCEEQLLHCSRHAGHHIACNTLTSWWSAWLNAHDDKIVMAPQRWGGSPAAAHLVPLHWLMIPTT